ncbi:MAG: alpha/beta hydrolase [Vicinamibacteria bacterium]|nr:alpha/beta hydrolase [Vicinamibacteria bacterium]
MSRLAVPLALAAAVFACGKPGPRPPAVVDLEAADGVILKGTYFDSGRPGPAVLLLHQCDDQRKVWDPLGTRLAALGVSALAFDYRGYGESGGLRHDKLTPESAAAMVAETWPKDIDLALEFLRKQPGVDPAHLGVAGGSCGVNNALRLAARRPSFKAFALLAGPVDRAGRRLLESPGSPPVFAAAAADDKYGDFVATMGWIAGSSTNPRTRFAHYQDGGHAAVVFTKHPDLADAIARWFAATLQSPPGDVPATNGVPMKAEMVKALRDLDSPDGAAAVGQALANARKADPHAVLFPEAFANQIGYEHLADGDVRGGLAIMALNVESYPESPNALDSLGDAYLASGDKAAALRLARQTIALLERDTIDTAARKEQIREAAAQKLKQLSPNGK